MSSPRRKPPSPSDHAPGCKHVIAGRALIVENTGALAARIAEGTDAPGDVVDMQMNESDGTKRHTMPISGRFQGAVGAEPPFSAKGAWASLKA